MRKITHKVLFSDSYTSLSTALVARTHPDGIQFGLDALAGSTA